MSRLIGTIAAAIALLSVTLGCTWQQAYSAGQTWQRNACNRLIEQTERERCLSNANMPYEDYRRQSEGNRKDWNPRSAEAISSAAPPRASAPASSAISIRAGHD